jgi:dihydrofolate reductase
MSDRINSMTKSVVSSTLRDPEWNNTTIISGDSVAASRRLTEQPSQDIVSTGSASCPALCSQQGLLDELRLWVHPLFVSQATPAGRLFRPSATARVELTGTLALTRRVAKEKCRHTGPTAR